MALYALLPLLFAAFPLVPIAVLSLNRLPLPRPHAHGALPEPGRSITDLLRHRELRPIFITSGLLATAWDTFTFAIPIYGSAIGLSASSIALVLGSFSVATFVIRVLLPAISRRLAPWPLLTVSLATAGAAFLLFPPPPRARPLAAPPFVLGPGPGAAPPQGGAPLPHTPPPAAAPEGGGR